MLPTAIRRRLTLPIMCALLMTMSLLLTVPPHTAFAQKSSGDAIRYYAAITNSSGQPTPATRSPTLTKSGTFTFTPMIRLRWIGGTNSQHREVLIAWANALLLALNASQRPADDLFIAWFGDYDPDRFAYVMDNYQSVSNSMSVDLYTIDFTGASCPSNASAYTHKGARTIWLCPAFWTLPSSGMDSKSGTLLHEDTHDVAMTEDYVYGPAACRRLAANDPDRAINNADNYEYYAMI